LVNRDVTQFHRRWGVRVLTSHQVLQIHPQKRQLLVQDLPGAGNSQLPIPPWCWPPGPGRNLRNRDTAFCATPSR
jgi:hypothetical protein